MTFAEYVRTARVTDTPQGDFIRDARCDLAAIERIRTVRELVRYLERIGASSGAILAAGRVWANYQRAKR